MLSKIILFFLCVPLYALINLEEVSQDFVLETRKIDIPEFPYAFNPSITRYGRHLLMSFRLGTYPTCSDAADQLACRIPKNRMTTQVGVVLLDADFQLVSKPQVLEIPNHDPTITFYPQDPRLLSVGNRIYAVYNNYIQIDSVPVNRMYFAEIYFDGTRFVLGSSECITRFDGYNRKPTEKNWAPFDYQGRLNFEYSLSPHKVFQTIPGTGSCLTWGIHTYPLSWQWGELRGGTPALLCEDQYLGFFHSSTALKTVHSKGKKITHYFMGAYTFSASPPFNMTSMSATPIIAPGFYTPQRYNNWKPLLGVFPAGYIFDEEFIWVSYGRQDHEIWVVKLDKKGLLASLSPVEK